MGSGKLGLFGKYLFVQHICIFWGKNKGWDLWGVGCIRKGDIALTFFFWWRVGLDFFVLIKIIKLGVGFGRVKLPIRNAFLDHVGLCRGWGVLCLTIYEGFVIGNRGGLLIGDCD